MGYDNQEPSMDGVNHFRFEINYSGLEFHRNWGIKQETGWFALKDGEVLVKFGTLQDCAKVLGPEIVQKLYDALDYINEKM